MSSVEEFRTFLLSESSSSFRDALDAVHLASALGQATGRPPDPLDFRRAGVAIADTVHTWVAAAAEPGLAPPAWLEDGEISLDVLEYRGRAAELLAIGAFLVATGLPEPEQLFADLERVAFGVDDYSVVIGNVVVRRQLEIDPRQFPRNLVEIRAFIDSRCLAGVMHAGVAFGQVASRRPRPMAGASISRVDPPLGCAGDTVTIHGAGFGASRPQDVEVMFTASGGGCLAANVTSWSDTRIVVTVPARVGHGCVGITRFDGSQAELASAASVFAGELETCLGPVATMAAKRIRESAFQIQTAACPQCNDPRTRFTGGPPVITTFAANGREAAEILPGQTVTLTWEIRGADQAVIVPLEGGVPGVAGPIDAVSGSATITIAMPDGTVGSWRLSATNRCGTTQRTARLVVAGRKAFVLSGGGAKGAFEIGAVRCLRDVANVTPDILSGTSIGAFNATKLAEGGVALSELETLWLAMQDDSALYLERQWFRLLEPIFKSLFKRGSSNLSFEVAGFVGSYVANQILGQLASMFGIPGVVYSIFTSFYPAVTGAVDIVRYYNAVKAAMTDPSIFLLTPFEQMVDGNIDPTTVAQSGILLRITAVGLESGRTRVFDQDGAILGTSVTVAVREAVKASASTPLAFPPVVLAGPDGDEHYVDGGVRENVPLQAAVEAGAHRAFVIMTNPVDVAVVGGLTSPRIIDIAGRCVDVVLDEAQRNDIFPVRGFGIPLTVIAPSFIPYDTLLVDPGLIRINLDYGYMRAYDEVVADPDRREAMRLLSDEITALRLEAWNAEHWANGERLPGAVKGVLVPVPDPVALQNARTAKKTIRTKAYQRIGATDARCVPGYRARWWQEWEQHPWTPQSTSPWDLMISRLGTLPAEPPPPP
jgi:NTE family protein